MTPKELSLIKQKYCEDHFYRGNVDLVGFELVKTNNKGQGIFLVSIPGKPSVHYELVKQDLSGYNDNKTLSIPHSDRHQFSAINSKVGIAEWINRGTGIAMIESDIASLSASKTHLTVIIAADSMRFKSDFRLIRL